MTQEQARPATESDFQPESEGQTIPGAQGSLVERLAEAIGGSLGCKPYDGPWNALNQPVCDRHGEWIWTEAGCPIAVAASEAVLPLLAAQVEAAVSVVRAEAAESIALWSSLYREAVGVPASEHQQRRAEQIAEQWEAAIVERDAALAALGVERGSLGTPEAKALRATVDPGHARAVVQMSEWMARAESAESERDALREKVAKVEALHVGAGPHGAWCGGCHDGSRLDVWPCATIAALSDPTTPDQPEDQS